MITVAIVTVILLGGALIGLALFPALRWWVVNVEVGEDTSRKAKATEVAQAAFIIPYLILVVWISTGSNKVTAVVLVGLTIVANVLVIRHLKSLTPSNPEEEG